MSARNFIIYDVASGRIVATGRSSSDPAHQCEAGQSFRVITISAEHIDVFHVVDGALVRRPVIDLEAVPVGTEARYLGRVVAVNDVEGPFEILIDEPGVHEVELVPPWPMRGTTVTIEVPA